jgi:pectin methylesterase-like acyl-CoA thioesterase
MDHFTNAAALVTGIYAGIRARLSRLGLAGLILGCLFTQTSMAAVVGSCKGGVHYPTIQQGVAHTPAGGTVSICPGTYPEQVMINKDLTLSGIVSGPTDSAIIAAPAGGVVQNATDLFDGSGIGAQVVVVGGVIANFNNLIIDGIANQISG